MNTTETEASGVFPAYFGSGLWISVYCVIICAACGGNILTISAIIASRHLSAIVSNQFIFSLGVSDLLVGTSIPYHMCFYMVDAFGESKNTCLVRFVLITFACASSILNLFLIASDRYAAIVHPLQYNRYMTRKISIIAIAFGWIVSLTVSIVPIYWNTWDCDCDMNIVPRIYFNFVLTPMFVLIWGLMLIVYLRIWREAHQHTKRMRNNANFNQNNSISDTKSIQVVMLTLGCFSICWMPYFIVTTYYRISDSNSKFSILYEIAFTMGVGNSGMNPMIYAWKNSNFRQAFLCLLKCQSPNLAKTPNYITNHVPSSRKSTLSGHENHATDIDIEMNINVEQKCSDNTDIIYIT